MSSDLIEYILPSLATWLYDGFIRDGWIYCELSIDESDCIYVDNKVICFYDHTSEIKKYNLIDNSQTSIFLCRNDDAFQELAWSYKQFLYSVKFPFLIGFICGYQKKIILVNLLTLSIIHEWIYDNNDDLAIDAFDEFLLKCNEDLFTWNETENELIIKTHRESMFKVEITYRHLSFADTKLENKNFVKYWSLDTTFSFDFEYYRSSIADNIFHISQIGNKNEGHHYLDTIRPICRHIFKTNYMMDLRYTYIRYTIDVNGYCIAYLNDRLVCIIQKPPLSFYNYKPCTCKIIIE